MPQPQHQFPPLPSIGLPESYYANLAKLSDRRGDLFGREAAKVGQYLTLALDPRLDWTAKRRYFEHALRRHCMPPPVPHEEVWLFYQRMAELVRRQAGMEALRVASAEDDQYARLTRIGRPRKEIVTMAAVFFNTLVGGQIARPDWLNEEDWVQLKLLRAQWA